jgi:hypothetical protein
MRRLTPLLTLIATLLIALTGCGVLPSFSPLPGNEGGTASSGALWSDVPPIPGSSQLPVGLPLSVKLLVKGFVDTARSSEDNNGPEFKDYDFKVYQAAGPGTDVSGFYTGALMSATGWTRNEDTGGTSSPFAPAGGTLCLYTKPAPDGFTDNLAILLMPGAGDGGKDQVAYVRFSNKG